MRLGRLYIFSFILLNIIVNNIYGLDDSLKVDSNYAKIASQFIVERIILVGNDVTKEEVILRELKTKEGNNLDLKILQEDIMRLYNLKLFNRVDVLPAPISSSRINLVFEFEETFYFLPIPQGGIKEGSFKKIWGGVNFQWRNFRGRNQTVGLSFGVGYEPFVNVSFFNPWVFGNSHYFYSFNAGYSRNYSRISSLNDSGSVIFDKNDIPTFSLNNFYTDFQIGKYFSEHFSISTAFSLRSINTSVYEQGRTISKNGKDFYPSLALNFSYDTRDYSRFATYGSFYNFRISRIGLWSGIFDLNKFQYDLRRFIPIKLSKDYALVLAARAISTITFGGGEMPVYLKESFGYDNFIRGWDNFVFQGENKFLGSLELRIPVIKPFFVKGKRHIILRKIPVLKDLSYRYGLYASLFFDFGGVWERKDRIYDTQFKNGFGIGLNFLLPFDFVGRTDFALRKINNIYKGQVVFSLDASF